MCSRCAAKRDKLPLFTATDDQTAILHRRKISGWKFYNFSTEQSKACAEKLQVTVAEVGLDFHRNLAARFLES
jgi:hypothetical protein